MSLMRLTHERYERMRAAGTFPSSAAPSEPPVARPLNDDLPTIAETRPTWWQVRRVEEQDGQRREVLIFESRDETAAIVVCTAQRYLCRLVKWGSRAQPYTNGKAAKVIEPPADPRRI